MQDIMEHPDFDTRDVSSLKSIGGGGGPFPASQHEKTQKKFKGAAPGQGYGLTEVRLPWVELVWLYTIRAGS
jgi:long-chain acyl-CoA synthetase